MIKSVTVKVGDCDSSEHAETELFRASKAAWEPEMAEMREMLDPTAQPEVMTQALVIELEPGRGFKGRHVTVESIDLDPS